LMIMKKKKLIKKNYNLNVKESVHWCLFNMDSITIAHHKMEI